jgi:hypothetical protein
MRYLPILFALLSAWSVFGQVPNYEFEEWDSLSISSIANWSTIGQVERVNNNVNGDFAIKLSNRITDKSFGLITNANIDTRITGGSSYNDMPFVLRFDVKYNLALGDTATVLAFFKVAGQINAQVNFKFTGSSADTFVRIKYPIQWIISTSPDSVLLLVSSHTLETPVQGDGSITIDNIVFETFGNPDEQLPNTDFEDWIETSIPYPKTWYTTDRNVYDTYESREPIKSVVQTNESHYKTGLLLQNKRFLGGILPGMALTGETFSDKFPPAFPVSQAWKYLQGYYKYAPQNNDSGTIAVLMYLKGNLIGSVQLSIVNPKHEITYFSVPITYYLPLTPDSACIVLSSAGLLNPKGEDTKLWIDRLSFSNNIASNDELEIELKLYPNPVSQTLFIEANHHFVQFEVYNDLGQLLISTHSKEIDVQVLSTGCYTLVAKNEFHSLKYKFVKL